MTKRHRRRGRTGPVIFDEAEVAARVAAHGPTPYERRSVGEWQYAADLAGAVLLVDDGRMFGLLEGGPAVDRERARRIIDQAARRAGVEPVEADVVRHALEFVAGWNAEVAEQDAANHTDATCSQAVDPTVDN